MPKIFTQLLKEYMDICLFRKRPQDLPAARELFWLTIFMYTVMSSILSYPSQSLWVALITGCVESIMLMLITYLFLYLRSVPERWLQTSTALAGAGLIFSLLALPLFYLRVFILSGASAQSFVVMLILCLVFWNISVMSYIFRNALSSSYFMAVLGAVCYISIVTLTLQGLFPVSEAP